MRRGNRENPFSWEYLGALLANEDHEKQTVFFKAFLRECASWGTAQQVEMQLCCINQELTPKERETLSMLSYKGDGPA